MPVRFFPLVSGNYGYALCDYHAGSLTISQATDLPCDQCEIDLKLEQEMERAGNE